jgi:hypothetical protein
MTKKEMIKELKDGGFETDDLNWKELQASHRENIKNAVKVETDDRPKIEKIREKLFPEIVTIMNKLKGKTNATQGEIKEMFRLYNAFYIRADNPNCGACVARVYRTFKKICKGRM